MRVLARQFRCVPSVLAAGALAAAMVVAAPAGTATAYAATAAARPAVTGWSPAEQLPGTQALNTGGNAVPRLSCRTAGNCSVGGSYTDSNGHDQVYVDSEVDGTWGTAEEVPGTATLNKGDANLWAISCGSAGNCSAGGAYTDSLRHEQSFVVQEKAGTWGTAKEVPGTATLNAGGTYAQLGGLSCATATACSGVGWYTGASGHVQGYVVSQTGGIWGSAKQVPGLAALNAGGAAEVQWVSCVSAGNCAAGGYYTASSGASEPFVVSQTGGTWGSAQQVPGIGTLNTQQGEMTTLSCGSVGNCSAGGSYTDGSGNIQAWLATEAGGVWGSAQEVPGTAALNTAGFAVLQSMSCRSAGNCSAGGWYTGPHIQGFVITETGGTWGSAQQVPNLAALNTGGDAQLWSVSCASAGNCDAGGSYFDAAGEQAFVVTQTKGTWGKAQEVPGTATLNVNGEAQTQSLSCATAAHCAAAGIYGDSSSAFQVFVATQT